MSDRLVHLFAVLAVLGMPSTTAAQFPELPTLEGLGVEYISRSGFYQILLSGQLDVEGVHVANDWNPSTDGLNECDACHVDTGRAMRQGSGTKQLHRLRVFADIFLGDHVYSLVELRADRGRESLGARNRGRVEQAFLRAVTGSGHGVQAGLFASPFGSYGQRHLTSVDPFLTPPLPYDYRTVMNRWRIPGSGDAVLQWKDNPEDLDVPGAPPIWDVPYQWGAMLFGRVGPVDLRAAAMNSAPSSHPNAWLDWDGFRKPSWVFGARWQITPSLEFGASYDRGPWMAPPIPGTRVTVTPPDAPPITPPSDWRDFDQELIAADLSFARGPMMLRVEVVRDSWEVPNVEAIPAGLSASLEAQTDLAAGFFVAGRAGFIDFGSVGGEDWDHDVRRLEGAVGYRLARNVGLLFSAYQQSQADAPDGDTTFGGLRVWWAF